MTKQEKRERVGMLTAKYMQDIVEVFKDKDDKLAEAANDALAEIKQEGLFKVDLQAHLDSLSIIAIASILGY